MRNSNDYAAVNLVFQKAKLGAKPSSVASALNLAFTTTFQRQALAKSFRALGLKFDGQRWSLSGIPESRAIITLLTTRVWRTPRSFVVVPPNMVLGKEVSKRGDHTVFENEGRLFLVESRAVSYYKPNHHE